MVNKSVNFWTYQNVNRPQNTFFGTGIWKIWKPCSTFWKHENMKTMLTEILCRMAVTLFQTSSWGSGLKQKRFGIKFKNIVNMQSSFKSGSDLLFRKLLDIVLFENGPSKYYINILITVMVLPRIILTSLSLSWSFHGLIKC